MQQNKQLIPLPQQMQQNMQQSAEPMARKIKELESSLTATEIAKAKLEASRAKVITMETERLESLEERSLLKATQEQLRYEADAALAALPHQFLPYHIEPLQRF